jgi:hypothetical protein
MQNKYPDSQQVLMFLRAILARATGPLLQYILTLQRDCFVFSTTVPMVQNPLTLINIYVFSMRCSLFKKANPDLPWGLAYFGLRSIPYKNLSHFDTTDSVPQREELLGASKGRYL